MKRLLTRFARKAKTCAICFDLVEFQGCLDSCKHQFCFDCVERWAEVLFKQTTNKCPLCKQAFSVITRKKRRVEYRAKTKKVVKLVPPQPKESSVFVQLLQSVHDLFVESIQTDL